MWVEYEAVVTIRRKTFNPTTEPNEEWKRLDLKMIEQEIGKIFNSAKIEVFEA